MRSAGSNPWLCSLRRLAFVRSAQRVGLTLDEVREALSSLPDQRTPSLADCPSAVRHQAAGLDERIAELERLRDSLTSCIGCGCLSLRRYALYNPADRAAALGSGARYLLGDRPSDVGA